MFRDGDEIELGSRNERPLTRYFPELADRLREQLPARVVVDGEIVIATEHGLDFDLLSLRIHPAASRIAKLAEEIPASFVAFDLLADGDDDLRELPFGDRRKRLEKLLKKAKPPIHITPATTDDEVAEQWFERFEGAGLDGVVAKPLDGPYREGQRTMAKVKHLRTADCVVAGSRVHKDGKGVGSLLLGLYDGDGRPPPRRGRQQLRRAAAGRAREVPPAVPRRTRSTGHPWREWADAAAQAEPGSRMPGGLSRWNAGKDLSWDAVRLELRRRGRVRAPAGGPVPPHGPVPALAPRPRPGVVHLRAARHPRPRRAPRSVRGLSAPVCTRMRRSVTERDCAPTYPGSTTRTSGADQV